MPNRRSSLLGKYLTILRGKGPDIFVCRIPSPGPSTHGYTRGVSHERVRPERRDGGGAGGGGEKLLGLPTMGQWTGWDDLFDEGGGSEEGRMARTKKGRVYDFGRDRYVKLPRDLVKKVEWERDEVTGVWRRVGWWDLGGGYVAEHETGERARRRREQVPEWVTRSPWREERRRAGWDGYRGAGLFREFDRGGW